MTTTTFDGLRDIIVRDFELAPEHLRRDSPLEEIELDSLAIAELVFALEDEFHVTAGNAIPPFKNLGDIADYIDRLIAERDAAPKAAKAPTPKPGHAARAKSARDARAKRASATRVSASKGSRAGNGTSATLPKPAVTNGVGRANGTANAAKKHAARSPSGGAPSPKRKRASATTNRARPR